MNAERTAAALGATMSVLLEVRDERAKQDVKWGEQNHPDGTGGRGSVTQAQALRKLCDARFAAGKGAWTDILMEEIAEAWAEEAPALLRAELVQVAAVAVAWIECIDRRQSRSTSSVVDRAQPEEQRRQGAVGDGEAATPGLSVASAEASQPDVAGTSR